MKRRLFFSLVLSCLLICLLAACGDASPATTNAGAAGAPSTTQNQSTLPIQMAIGRFKEFALPQNNSGLMRPIVDTQGRVWFGEMSRNYLGSFDPRSGKFWQQTPPMGKAGIMGMAAAPDGTVWFAEQYADYIGHFFPQTGQYKTYQLPTITTSDPSNAGKTLSLPSAPNDIALDTHSTLWFTELNANAIGSLNTATGETHQYALSSDPKASSLDPYGITIDPQGTVWFSESSTNRLGKLNPATGQISYFTPPGVTTPLMELASDAHGQIWVTTFGAGQLLRFDPARATFTTYNAPALNGIDPGALYGLTIATNGDAWVTVGSENVLARLDVKAQRFLYYTIPTASSLPLGLVEGANGSIWFTEAGSNKIGMLQP